ncbi:MAG: 5'/3'-nucleotidase SurE [Planctomycetota bacterium]
MTPEHGSRRAHERGTFVFDEERRRRSRDGPRLLVTNDDGIDAPGLQLLARRLAARYEVVVVAPKDDCSGSGTGIGRVDAARGVGFTTAEVPGVEEAYAIAGPPGLAVMAATLGAFGGAPDLVVSGVNAGLNTGHSVIHSGTVGAALTARTFGGRGVAISLARSNPWHWEAAVAVACDVVEWMLRHREPSVLNVNVPALTLERIRGAKWARLDAFGYFRVATSESGKNLEFDVRSKDSGRDADSDTGYCFAGFVTLTPLSTVEPEDPPNVSARDVVPVLDFD